MEYTTGDVICLYLGDYDVSPDAEVVPEGLTAAGIASVLDLQTNVNDRVELLSELRSLQDRGLVADRVRPVGDGESRRRTYFLTDEGRRHGEQVYERLRDRTVVVSNGVTEEIPLADADRFFDDHAVVRALTSLEDGRIDLDEYSGRQFFDRTEALSSLVDAYEAAGNHVPRGLLVAGEAGVGKTSLFEEFRQSVADRDPAPTVASGACTADADEPYQGIEGAIDDLEGAPRLGDLLEAIEATPGDDGDAARYQRRAMFADVADAIRVAARESPVVLCVEDLQWAGEPTLALLEHLLSSLDEWIYHVLVVGTYRPGGVDAEHPLADLVDTVERVDRHGRVDLEPLGEFDTRGILQRQFDTDSVPDHFLELVHDRTGGNPLFVEETARQLLETDLVDPQQDVYPTDEDEITLPDRVTETVADRLAALDETGRTVLELGAVAGPECSTELLEVASDLDDPTIAEYVDVLVGSHIWERVDDGIRFLHGVVRTTVLDGLDDERARRRHEAIADALETVHAESLEEYYAAIAYHYERADRPELAVEYYRLAGDRARSVHAPETAIANYEQALELVRKHDLESVPEALVSHSLAETHSRIGQYDTAQDYIDDGLDVVADVDAHRELLALAADIALSQGDFDRALEYTRQGLALDGPESPAVLRLLDRQSRAHLVNTDFDRARETARRQLELAEALDDPREIGAAKTHLGLAADRNSEYDRAQEHLLDAVDVFEERGDRYKLGDALDQLASVSMHAGRYDRSRDLRQRSIDIAEEVGARRALAQRINNLALLEDRLRNWEAANEHFREALDATREIGDTHGENTVLYNLATSLVEWGQYDRARERLLEALDQARENDYDRLVGASLSGLGAIAIETGNLAVAADRLDDARPVLEDAAEDRMVARNVMRYGDLQVARGEYDQAREHYEDALSTFEEIGVVKLELKTVRRFVDLEQRLGNADRALEWCSRGLALIESELPADEFADLTEWFETRRAELREDDSGSAPDD